MRKKILAVLLLFPFLAFGQEGPVTQKVPETNWEHISRTGASLLRHFWEDRSTGNASHVSQVYGRKLSVSLLFWSSR